MPLPSPELIGLTDPREVSGDLPPRAASTVAAPAHVNPPAVEALSTSDAPTRALPQSERASRPTRARQRAVPSIRDDNHIHELATLSRVAPEDRTFVQIMVAAEVRERLADASYALEDVRPGLHLQQTIVGALIARHVDPDDPRMMDATLVRLATWSDDPLSERRGEALKLGWRLPHSLTRRLDKVVLRLKATHRHLAPSAKALLASLIMSELEPGTPAGVERLVDLVTPYVERYERPVASPALADSG